MTIRYDYHLHSDFSGDCEIPSEVMIERALSLGLQGLCFTEHHDQDLPEQELVFTLDFDAYLQKMSRLKSQYADRIRICSGIEFGMMEHLPPVLQTLLNHYSFDFVIASLHFIDGKDPYYPEFFEGKSERECYEEFLQTEYELLKCFPPESYDTLGHMDFIVRYGPNQNREYSYEAYADYIDPILRHLIENGKCLEVNTGGFKYGLGEPNPCAGVLRRYRELGGELLTIGSDAHDPKHLCFDFDRAQALLLDLGFRYYTVFQKRKMELLPLNG